MAPYARSDLDSDWEFKIVRATTPAFRTRETLDKLIEEEARAGWVLLEKLDDHRVRFKRPPSARAKDAYLPAGVDAYRTTYGGSPVQIATIVALAIGLAVFLLAVVAIIGFGLVAR